MARFAHRLICLAFGTVISLLATVPAYASGTETGTDPSLICDAAAMLAARETGVPLSVLKAISLTETGRKRAGKMRPWPWTVNMEGKGVWFDSPDELTTYVETHHARGARSYDVGCFQLNYKWHGQNFTSLQEMMEPRANALYAARFLQDLYAEKGNWNDAAGAYHSRTKKYADRYKKRFDQYRSTLLHEDTAPPTLPAGPLNRLIAGARVNTYPLLVNQNAARTHGSLVALPSAGAGALFTASARPLGG